MAADPTPMSEGVDLEALEKARREEVAKLVYEAMRWGAENAENKSTPDWVEYGNSFAQTEARRAAIRIRELEAARPAPAIPAVGGLRFLIQTAQALYDACIADFGEHEGEPDEQSVMPGVNSAIRYGMLRKLQSAISIASHSAPPPASGGENELREAARKLCDVVNHFWDDRERIIEPRPGLHLIKGYHEDDMRGATMALEAALAPPAHDHAQGER